MRIIVIFVAIAISAIAFFVTLKMVGKEDEEVKIVQVPVIQKPDVPTVDVIVARAPIPIGTVIDETMLDRQPWPSHLVVPDFITVSGKEGDIDILGRVTRAPFQEHEPIIRTKLANPNDPSFLAAALEKGMRAVTIPINATSGVAGFIFPGDRVDIVLTHNLIPSGPSGGANAAQQHDERQTVTEVLLPNIKVLGVDQRSTSEGQEKPAVPATATVEVTQEQAQKLILAQRKGEMSLELRPLQDKDAVTVVPPTTVNDLSRLMPPSYFPVLFENTGYQPQLVDVFADKNKDASGEAKEGQSDAEMQAQQAQMEAAAPGFSASITIIRGTQKENVGVENP